MRKYLKQEDAIIVGTVKKYSRKGAPLNIQAALDEAGDEIFDRFGINRSLAALSQRYYTKLRKQYLMFGYRNVKNTFTKPVVVPTEVIIDGKRYTLTLNLAPALVKKLVQHGS